MDLLQYDSHGLKSEENVKAEEIIKSCFSNKDRKNFPNFPKLRGWGEGYDLCHDHDQAEWYIENSKSLMPSVIQDFNLWDINLHNTDFFFDNLDDDPEQPPVDTDKYLDEITRSRWYGPYKSKSYEYYYFLSIIDSGENKYLVRFQLSLDTGEHQTPSIALFFEKDCS